MTSYSIAFCDTQDFVQLLFSSVASPKILGGANCLIIGNDIILLRKMTQKTK